jgi:hypothetical protein
MLVDRSKVQCRNKEQLELRSLTSHPELDEEAGGYEGQKSVRNKIPLRKKPSLIAHENSSSLLLLKWASAHIELIVVGRLCFGRGVS